MIIKKVCIIPFGVFLKLWASGQSDAFSLLLLGFTVDVHTFFMLSIFREDKLNHFVFYAENFHPSGTVLLRTL